jgi:hypothetical protein
VEGVAKPIFICFGFKRSYNTGMAKNGNVVLLTLVGKNHFPTLLGELNTLFAT